MDVARTAVSIMGLEDKETKDNSLKANLRKVMRIFAKTPVALAAFYRSRKGKKIIPPKNNLSFSENFFHMCFGKVPNKDIVKAFDVSLILYAEHSFNVSTFTARTITSSLSDIHGAITGAIASLKGPLHGGANEEVMHMMKKIKKPENALKWINKALDNKDVVMGFGHRVYKKGDSREPTMEKYFKKVSELKLISFFKGLGTYFDKVQRMRKLGGMLSDELLISKEKVELSASICKVDLVSELVGEFPELQGIMGGYFANEQGFEKEISLAISEQYLPIGLNSKVPKKPYSIALSLADKIDTLVGFFGINQKPTSSKDPFALRRLALGIIKIIIENKKDFKLRDLISYSSSLYMDQGFEFENKSLQNELADFLMDRLKHYMKEDKIRHDIIQASTNSLNLDQSVVIFGKAKSLNKIIEKPIGVDLILSYKRASNILENELKDKNFELSNTTDPGIFKTELEKNLFKKINELRKYFQNINKDENFEQSLENLAESKKIVFEFFDNVIVNEEDQTIKKNRLELIQMLCKTFDNYINFSLIDTH